MQLDLQGRALALWAPAAVLTVSALAFWWSSRRSSKDTQEGDLHLIPTATDTVPILGRVSVIRAAQKGKAHMEFEKIIDELPDATVIRIRLLGRNIILLADPTAAEELLRRNKFVPKLLPAYQGFYFLGSDARSIIMADQVDHERLRQTFQSFFSADNMSAVVAQLCAEMQAVCDAVRTRAQASPDGAAHVDVVDLAVGAIDGVVRKVFFESSQTLDMRSFHDALAHMGQTALNSWHRQAILRGYLPGSVRYRRNYKALRANWQALAREAYERPIKESDSAFWACLRRAFPNALNDAKEWEQVLANTAVMYGAGSETTANAIAMTLTALALDPETLRGLEEELNEAGLLRTPERPEPSNPTAEDLPKLRLLNAIYHESLRFFPPAAGASARQLDRELTIGGYRLPAGTAIAVPVWGLHRCRKYWGEDAKEWRPARWLEERSVNAAKKGPAGGVRWLPFSDGPQNCIGQHIATAETRLAIAMVVSSFRVEADQRLKARTPEEFAQACTALVTLCPRQGAWLMLTPRVKL